MNWISVKDRLPEEGQVVIHSNHEYENRSKPMYVAVGPYSCGEFYEGFKNWEDGNPSYFPIYWMPLPEPPKDGE